jgi:hypothetical protein
MFFNPKQLNKVHFCPYYALELLKKFCKKFRDENKIHANFMDKKEYHNGCFKMRNLKMYVLVR